MLQQIMMMVEMMKAKAALQQQFNGALYSIVLNEDESGKDGSIDIYAGDTHLTVYLDENHGNDWYEDVLDNVEVVFNYFFDRGNVIYQDDTMIIFEGGGMEFKARKQ